MKYRTEIIIETFKICQRNSGKKKDVFLFFQSFQSNRALKTLENMMWKAPERPTRLFPMHTINTIITHQCHVPLWKTEKHQMFASGPNGLNGSKIANIACGFELCLYFMKMFTLLLCELISTGSTGEQMVQGG